MSSFNSSFSGKSPVTSPKSSTSGSSSLLGRSLNESELLGRLQPPRVEVTSFDDEVAVTSFDDEAVAMENKPLQEQNVNENISNP